MTTNAPDNATLQHVPLDAIDCDIPNHRIVEDADRITELAASIEAHGLQQPVRVYEKDGGRYILGFGFRRLAAHRQLGRDTIPAFVLPPADAQDIRAAQAIENLHRQDLQPLEEAEACAAIADWAAARGDAAAEAAEVAARIGRPRAWVEGRLALLRLSARVCEMLLAGDILLGHAQLIARLASEDKQEEIAGRCMRSQFKSYGGTIIDRPPASIANCRRMVEAELRDLAGVNWKLDAEFAGLPACATCPRNSANTLGLFDDTDGGKPQCLDATCFAQKTKAASNAQRRAVNTLVKSGNALTTKQAEKAIAEREVEFIKPGAVAKAAKRAAAPKEPTPAERRGAAQNQAEHEARQKFTDALADYQNIRNDGIAAALRRDQYKLAMALLIACFPQLDQLGWFLDSADQLDGDQLAAWQILSDALDIIRVAEIPPIDALGLIAKKLTPPDPDAAPNNYLRAQAESWPLEDREFPELFLDKLAEVLGLPQPPKPQLKDFLPKQEPKAASKKKSAKEKKAAKKTA